MTWILIYYGIGVSLGIHGLATAEQRPADDCSLLVKAVVWINQLGCCGVFWIFGVVALVLESIRTRLFPGLIHSPDGFARDEDGQVWFTGSSIGGLVMMCVFLVALPGLLLLQMAFREDRLADFPMAFFVALMFSLPVILVLRGAWLTRFGLQCIMDELVWTECGIWNPTLWRIPLSAIEFAQSVETDPIDYEVGIALVLKEERPLINVPQHKLDDWIKLNPRIPRERLVLWEHDKWDWKPEQVLKWLESQGVPIKPQSNAVEIG